MSASGSSVRVTPRPSVSGATHSSRSSFGTCVRLLEGGDFDSTLHRRSKVESRRPRVRKSKVEAEGQGRARRSQSQALRAEPRGSTKCELSDGRCFGLDREARVLGYRLSPFDSWLWVRSSSPSTFDPERSRFDVSPAVSVPYSWQELYILSEA